MTDPRGQSPKWVRLQAVLAARGLLTKRVVGKQACREGPCLHLEYFNKELRGEAILAQPSGCSR